MGSLHSRDISKNLRRDAVHRAVGAEQKARTGSAAIINAPSEAASTKHSSDRAVMIDARNICCALEVAVKSTRRMA
ncbi:unnamed protein product [Zymoseptoria tritici ST99CH_3D1]|uniref:Uncharacterized protein n=1 Tax=Zymoseptoria tritici (strain ST99CH_3D7) TaxID=1276538 RepID=A0A1X7RT50_ZYMT9|nr:unnamed protein product [Zymoseptoria tritici ST99CH_3D7]SMR53470.1 unnamed protein product [Zymoseptoria tritici ST99CH_3D1]